NVARINFSHGSWADQKEKVDLVKKAREELNLPVALLLDMKGPEIRMGKFYDKVYLEEGNTFTIHNEDILGNDKEATISYKELYRDLHVGSSILIDDGLVRLEVTDIVEKDIVCKVMNSGPVSSNKGVNVPNVKLNLPSLTEKDINDILGAVENDMDYIAVSFVRRKEDVLAVRNILEEHNSNIKLISKIENREGVDNLDEIIEVSDGIMVARGDLGVEIPFSEVPIIQKEMIKKAYAVGKPVITATQMLESMTNNPNPTRAEVSDVANAIFDGTSAIMLSGETTLGKYPVECVRMMDKIACDVEGSIDYWKRFKMREVPKYNFEYIIDHAMITTALNIDVKGIFAYTKTSDTPRIVSSLRPKCPIFVTTSNKKVFYQLALDWGINVRLSQEEKDPKSMILDDIDHKVKSGLLKKDDIVLIAGGKYIPDEEDKEMNKSIGGIYQI
ncbi:MAG: pyruvate kinase, partial [Bacilli bacterium]|nr:pyruvate kinase [Bacilli bacterium]